jgi:hypothetical protein
MAEVRGYLKDYPGLIRLVRTPCGSFSGHKAKAAEAGWPDWTGFVPAGMPKRSGCAVLVECKAANSAEEAYEMATPEQRANLAAIVKAGGIGILAYRGSQFWGEYLDAIGLRDVNGDVVAQRKKASK